jgi:hypothetical protein
LADFSKMAEKWPNFFKVYYSRKNLSIRKKDNSIPLLIKLFYYYFSAEAFVKQPLRKNIVCGRIFAPAAEFFDVFGRNYSSGVGNTDLQCRVAVRRVMWQMVQDMAQCGK